MLVQVTVVPALTVKLAGLKAKFWIVTALAAAVPLVLFVAVLVLVLVAWLPQPVITKASNRTEEMTMIFFMYFLLIIKL